MTCAHPIPVTSPGPVPAIRYVQCEREAGHEEQWCGCPTCGPELRVHRHVEPDGTVRES